MDARDGTLSGELAASGKPANSKYHSLPAYVTEPYQHTPVDYEEMLTPVLSRPPGIWKRLLSPGIETSTSPDAWKQEQNGLLHPPAAPGCGRDGLPHLLGQRKAFQGEWRGRVGSYR